MKSNFLLFSVFIFLTQLSLGQELKDSIIDIDNNVYHKVKIDNQIWMTENLKVSHYRNGDEIPNIADKSMWFIQSTDIGAFCNYGNDEKNGNLYGHLYNWYAVNDKRCICPDGWHIPSDAEWLILADFLGGKWVAGGKLKEADTTHWANPNIGATNESGFTGLPGGYRNIISDFVHIGFYGGWWTADQYMVVYLNNKAPEVLNSGKAMLHGSYPESYGFSVRCIKDKYN